MPTSPRRSAAQRVAAPIASGCKARCLTLARRLDFAALAIERLGLALRIGTTPRARHTRANQWQEITKRVSRQLNRTSDLAWPNVVVAAFWLRLTKVWREVTSPAWGGAKRLRRGTANEGLSIGH